MFLGSFVQQLASKNIIYLYATSIDEGHGGLFIRMTKDLRCNLHDMCDAHSSGDHIEVSGKEFIVFCDEFHCVVIQMKGGRSLK